MVQRFLDWLRYQRQRWYCESWYSDLYEWVQMTDHSWETLKPFIDDWEAKCGAICSDGK